MLFKHYLYEYAYDIYLMFSHFMHFFTEELSAPVWVFSCFMYGIMTEELFIREIRIDKAAGRGNSDSRMTSFEVIMALKLQSTKILIYLYLRHKIRVALYKIYA